MRWSLISRSKTNAARAGFSLAEFAIVLAIMGLVLASLWGVVSIVRENIKRDEMANQMVLMINNIREFYSNRVRLADGSGNTDSANVTSYLLKQSVLLPEQIRDRSAGQLRADHPWGASAADGGALTDGGITVDGSPDPARYIHIVLSGLKYSTCVALADKLTGSNMPLGLQLAKINNNADHLTFPVSPDQASTECAKTPGGDENTMGFVYMLRYQDN